MARTEFFGFNAQKMMIHDEKLIFCLLFSVIASKHSGEQIASKISFFLWMPIVKDESYLVLQSTNITPINFSKTYERAEKAVGSRT